MVHHDDALGRLTEGGGLLEDMSAAQIKMVRFKTGTGRILTLAELCDLVSGRVPLLLELKSRFNADMRLAERAINVLASYGRPVWEAVWREVEKHGGCAYGTEAMHVMRAEKGYVIVGQETDGTVTLADLGLDWAIGKTKKDFVGKRSLSRPDIVAENRKQLVGLLTEDPLRSCLSTLLWSNSCATKGRAYCAESLPSDIIHILNGICCRTHRSETCRGCFTPRGAARNSWLTRSRICLPCHLWWPE